MNITVIVLVRNEEKHIARCLNSVSYLASNLLVVDCGSTDRTVEIARSMGAKVVSNPWVNYATQFNWALTCLPENTDWILRLDADEIVTDELASQIVGTLGMLAADVAGVFVSRRMTFLGQPIQHGGLFPIRVLRIFRQGKGRCEDRWMDEHIMVDGATVDLSGEIVDDNLNSLTWWTEKHNAYASREAVDLLNLEYSFMPHETVANLRSRQQTGVKRWIKERIYSRLPSGFRSVAYFLYRYFVRLGFLDGKEAKAFHVLQGFWYRYLVDMKMHEVRVFMQSNNVDVVTAIRVILGIDVENTKIVHQNRNV